MCEVRGGGGMVMGWTSTGSDCISFNFSFHIMYMFPVFSFSLLFTSWYDPTRTLMTGFVCAFAIMSVWDVGYIELSCGCSTVLEL